MRKRMPTTGAVLRFVGAAIAVVMTLVMITDVTWRSHSVVEALGLMQPIGGGPIVQIAVSTIYGVAIFFAVLLLHELFSYMPGRGQAGRSQEIRRVTSWLIVAAALVATSTWMVHSGIMRSLRLEVFPFGGPSSFNIWLTAALTAITGAVVLMPAIMGMAGWIDSLRPSRSNRLARYQYTFNRLRSALTRSS